MKAVRQRYSRIATYYDPVYRLALARGSRVLINVGRPDPGTHVLEVGAGTGYSLPHYPSGVRVTAIDICPEMLAVAATKVAASPATVRLVPMDAQNLAFQDDIFDLILFPHSLGLMEDPASALAEAARVAKDGAELRILHTFEWTHPVLNRIETKLYDAFENRLGWGRPLEFDRTVAWCAKNGFELSSRQRLGWKTILVFHKAL